MAGQTRSRLPRLGTSKNPLLLKKNRTVDALRDSDRLIRPSFFSRFQNDLPNPPEPVTPLRSFSLINDTSPSINKPLPSPPVTQFVQQETGRTLLDAAEVPVLVRSLSPMRPEDNEVQGFAGIPRPPAFGPDRTLQKKPSYQELKRKASVFVDIKELAEEDAPPVPPIPFVADERSTLTRIPTAIKGSTTADTSLKSIEPTRRAPRTLAPRSHLATPTPVSGLRKGSSSSPSIANPGSFNSTNSETKGSALSRPNGPPRSSGFAPPCDILNPTGVVKQAPPVLPPRSSPSSADRGRIPGVPIQTPYSVADSIEANKSRARALALARVRDSASADTPASPATVKSPTSSGPGTQDIAPVSPGLDLPDPPLPFASLEHSAGASQASQKSRGVKMLAGAPAATTSGTSHTVLSSHEDNIPKNPSPLRGTMTLEYESGIGETDAVTDKLIQAELPNSKAAPRTADQLVQAAIYSMPKEQRPAFMQLMTQHEHASADCAKKEKVARGAEMVARERKMDAEKARKVYARLNREVQDMVVIHTT